MRPDWDSYFMGLAFVISQRSEDKNTKHGCVLVDIWDNVILGTGYNGIVAGVDSSKFDLTRPAKYKYMIHAEENAILNSNVCLKNRGEFKVYVTGKCCNNCLQRLIQAGAQEIYMADRQGSALENEETQQDFDLIVKETGTHVEYVPMESIEWLRYILPFKRMEYKIDINSINEHIDKTRERWDGVIKRYEYDPDGTK